METGVTDRDLVNICNEAGMQLIYYWWIYYEVDKISHIDPKSDSKFDTLSNKVSDADVKVILLMVTGLKVWICVGKILNSSEGDVPANMTIFMQ